MDSGAWGDSWVESRVRVEPVCVQKEELEWELG